MQHAHGQTGPATQAGRGVIEPRAMRTLLIVLLSVAGAARATTLDELLAKNLSARGGAANLQKLQTLRLTGRASFAGRGGARSSPPGRRCRSAAARSARKSPSRASPPCRPGTARKAGACRRSAAAASRSAPRRTTRATWRSRRTSTARSSTGARRAARSSTSAPRTSTARPRTSCASRCKDGDVAVRLPRSRRLPRDPHRAASVDVRGTEQRHRDRLRRLRAGRRRVDPVLDRVRRARARRERRASRRARRGQRRRSTTRCSAYPARGTRSRAMIVAGPPTPSAAVQAPPAAAHAGQASLDAGVISGLGARNIGSAAMSGRIAAVAARNEGRQDDRSTSARPRGGVWKSHDGGTTFKPVFDKQPVQSIGAIAIDPTQPEDGLGRHRRGVDAQLGVDRRRHLQVDRRRRDLDATWACPSPSASRASSSHPKNGNIVYACVPGKLWSDSRRSRPLQDHRRRQDAGRSCSKGANLSTGCSGVTMDPKNPERAVRRHVGLPPQGLDVPLRRRRPRRAERQRPVPLGRRRQDLDEDHRRANKGLPAEAVGPRRGRGRAVESEDRLRARRVERRPRCIRSDDGGKTWERARQAAR